MDIQLIRTLYDYHYARFREIWVHVETLTNEQFVAHIPYSHGSLRNHLVHMIDDDEKWMNLMCGQGHISLQPSVFSTRAEVREHYDTVEAANVNFIRQIDEATLETEYLWQLPFDGQERLVTGWQILLHLVNHGTDHRAQVLRILHDFGADTSDQDLMGYLLHHGILQSPKS